MQAYPQHKQVLGFQGQGLLILYLIPDLPTKHTFPEGFLSLSEILISHSYLSQTITQPSLLRIR